MYSKPKSNRIELESPKTEEEKGQRWEEDEGRERNGASPASIGSGRAEKISERGRTGRAAAVGTGDGVEAVTLALPRVSLSTTKADEGAQKATDPAKDGDSPERHPSALLRRRAGGWVLALHPRPMPGPTRMGAPRSHRTSGHRQPLGPAYAGAAPRRGRPRLALKVK